MMCTKHDLLREVQVVQAPGLEDLYGYLELVASEAQAAAMRFQCHSHELQKGGKQLV
jgi:hypothetical protein